MLKMVTFVTLVRLTNTILETLYYSKANLLILNARFVLGPYKLEPE